MTRSDDSSPTRPSLVAGTPAPRVRSPHLWWTALAAGTALFAFVWFATPHGREIEALWQLAVKLLAFAFLCCAIAFFPRPSPRLHWLLYVPLLFFTAYLLPRISYFYFGDGERAQGDSFYTHLYLLLYPGIVLTVTAAYRLGGGSAGRCLKLAANGIVILFSGLLDVMWWVVNPVATPEVIDAPHITIFTGGPISFGATILFALAHVPIILAIALAPLDRWLDRALGVEPPARSR